MPSRQRKCLQFTDIMASAGVCKTKGAIEFVHLDGSFVLVAFTKHALQNEWKLPRLNKYTSLWSLVNYFIMHDRNKILLNQSFGT